MVESLAGSWTILCWGCAVLGASPEDDLLTIRTLLDNLWNVSQLLRFFCAMIQELTPLVLDTLRQYRRVALSHHPDKGGSKQAFVRLQGAKVTWRCMDLGGISCNPAAFPPQSIHMYSHSWLMSKMIVKSIVSSGQVSCCTRFTWDDLFLFNALQLTFTVSHLRITWSLGMQNKQRSPTRRHQQHQHSGPSEALRGILWDHPILAHQVMWSPSNCVVYWCELDTILLRCFYLLISYISHMFLPADD